MFEQGQKIVFIGDSITDAGRRNDPLGHGNGYFNLVRGFLLARYPDLGLTIVNKGIGGNTVRHLRERWQEDVIAERPALLSVMIGINDVWRTYDRAGEGAVGIEEYEGTYRELLREAVDASGTRLILADPYMIEPDRAVPMRAQMDEYGAVVARIASDFDAIHIRTQDAFDRVLRHTTPEDWAADQIHPNTAGHAVIAIEYLRAFGFDLG